MDKPDVPENWAAEWQQLEEALSEHGFDLVSARYRGFLCCEGQVRLSFFFDGNFALHVRVMVGDIERRLPRSASYKLYQDSAKRNQGAIVRILNRIRFVQNFVGKRDTAEDIRTEIEEDLGIPCYRVMLNDNGTVQRVTLGAVALRMLGFRTKTSPVTSVGPSVWDHLDDPV